MNILFQPEAAIIMRPPAMLSSILLLLLLSMNPGWAGSWQQALAARVATEYESNPALDPYYDGGIWRMLVEPDYTLTGTYNADELKAGLGVLLERSSDKTLSQDREDPHAFLGWKHQSETSELGVNARYEEVATRISEFDRASVVLANATRATRTVSAIWRKEMSERSTFAVDGSYSGVSYQGGTFIDYVTRSGGVMLSHAWSESSATFIKVAYIDNAPTSGGPIERRNSVMVGLNQKLTEQLEGTVQGGKSSGDAADSTVSQGGATLIYTGQVSRWLLNVERSSAPSGLGGFVTADQVNGSWSYDTSESSRIGVDLFWRKSHLAQEYLYRTGGIWLQQNLSALWEMRLYGERKISSWEEINGASSNVLGLSFVYTDPNF